MEASRVGVTRSAWVCDSGSRSRRQDIVCATGNSGISDNHSIAYCLLGYLCAYFRHYHPVEFITAFLNNAANDEDISNGTILAKNKRIRISAPKFGVSLGEYYFDSENRVIAKGLSSVKFMGKNVCKEIHDVANSMEFSSFSDVLYALEHDSSLDSRQLEILIKIDFFSDYGNQRELFAIRDIFDKFKHGDAKQIKRSQIDGTQYEPIVRKYSTWKTKSGEEAKAYTLKDPMAIIRECEQEVLNLGIDDLPLLIKAKNFQDIMGYGYISGNDADRNKLCVKQIYPLKRKKDGVQFGYTFVTQSIGSGIESRFTVKNGVFEKCPVQAGDMIVCNRWHRDGAYFHMTAYNRLN